MRRLFHLSDLHFGHLDERTLEPLREAVAENEPDLVVVSGDLTQRAKARQFREARAFLESLGAPWLATPGNHDVPLWNVFDRFFRPLHRFREHFSTDPEPQHLDEEIAIMGINTARSLVVKGGRINLRQMSQIEAQVAQLPGARTKVIVTHHPLATWPGLAPRDRAGRADRAIVALTEARVDLLLAGHLHLTHAAASLAGPRPGGWGIVGVSAGTATSSRLRAEENGFNLIDVTPSEIRVVRWRFDGERFHACETEQHFRCDARGWRGVRAPAPDQRENASRP